MAGDATAAQTRFSSRVARKDGMHSTIGTLQKANNETSIASSPEDSSNDGDAGNSTAVLTSIHLSFFKDVLILLLVDGGHKIDGQSSFCEAHNVMAQFDIVSHGLDIVADGQNC
jgi:hypothetical protein